MEDLTEYLISDKELIPSLINYFSSDNDTVWKENITDSFWSSEIFENLMTTPYNNMLNVIRHEFNHEGYLAINVKQYYLFNNNLDNIDSGYVYDELQSIFWHKAEVMSFAAKYNGVVSEGRSRGWLCPIGENGLIKIDYFAIDKSFDKYMELQRFFDFQENIDLLIKIITRLYRNLETAENINTITNRIYEL
jgi:hypothetical protein